MKKARMLETKRYMIHRVGLKGALGRYDDLATAKKDAQALAKTTHRSYEVLDYKDDLPVRVYVAEGRLWKIGACSLALLAVLTFGPVSAWAQSYSIRGYSGSWGSSWTVSPLPGGPDRWPHERPEYKEATEKHIEFLQREGDYNRRVYECLQLPAVSERGVCVGNVQREKGIAR